MKRRRSSLAALAIALAALAASGSARPQSQDDLAKARTRFDEGLGLAAAGDWANALGAFQDVARIKLTPQVRFHIARCEEHLGYWVRALGNYRLVVVESEHVAGTDEARKMSLEAVTRLERDTPRLAITVENAPAGAEVLVDGKPIGAMADKKTLLVDPGPHRVEAKIEPQSVVRSVDAAAGQTIAVPLAFGPHPPPEAPRPLVTRPAPAPAGAFVLLGVGALGAAAGVVGLVVRQNAIAELDAQCTGGHCPSDLESVGQRGTVANAITIGGFATAGVALALGVVWLTLPRRARVTSAVRF